MSLPDQDPALRGNPEWIQNRDQNIAMAQRIQAALIHFINPNSTPNFFPELIDSIGSTLGIEGEVIEKAKEEVKKEEVMEGYRYSVDRLRTISDGVRLSNIMDPEMVVHLDVAYIKSIETDGEFTGIPQDFLFPAYKFMVYYQEKIAPVKTLYGILPGDVIGADGRLYSFINYAFFNRYGQGALYQNVEQVGKEDQTLTEVLENNDLTETELIRLQFTPSSNDSRTNGLEQADYKEIDDILKQIEGGEFISLVI